jgi:hypothetical protein
MIIHKKILPLHSKMANRHLIFILLMLLFLSAKSQKADTLDIIREKPEKLLKNLRIQNVTQGGFNFWDDDFSGHWAGVDFGLNTLTGKGFSDEYPAFLEHDIFRSNALYVNIVQQSIGLQKTRNTIGLVTGLGFQFRSFRLDNNTTIVQTPSGNITGRSLVFDVNQKSKFSMVYLIVPLLLEFQVPVNHYDNRLFVSGGLTGGYRLSAHTKIKYKADRNKEKLKTPGDYSLNDFKYAFMVRLGYRQYQVFVNYDLQPMFNDKANVPDIHPLTVGLTLVSF